MTPALRRDGEARDGEARDGSDSPSAPAPPEPSPSEPPPAPDPAALQAQAADFRAQAEAALRIRDQVLAAVSHDLKNPLTVIRAQAQVLARRYGPSLPPQSAQRFLAGLDRIQEETIRLARWVDELSDFSRLQLGHDLPLDRHSTDLIALARRVCAELQRSADLHHLALRSSLPSLTGHWDEARLERALLNVIGNAVKYSPDGGDVTIAVSLDSGAEPPQATVRVTDHGIGIPASDLPRVFEAYYRAPNAGHTIPGSGLGLFTVRHIVTRHGGTVDVESQEGHGTAVSIRLPLRSP
jgi:signal transduction histidine kinase